MAEHTPGPWQLHDPDYCDEEVWGDIDGPTEGQVRGQLVAVVEQDNKAWRGNARLIAAAPTLLAALKELAILGEVGMTPNPYEWLTFHDKVAQIARAAIAKAEGR